MSMPPQFVSLRSACRPKLHLHHTPYGALFSPASRQHVLWCRTKLERAVHQLTKAAEEGSTVGEVDWVEANADALRSLPLYAGGLGVVAVVLNRAIFGIAPVVDASSSQSRADVVVIIVSAALLLTGLSWLSIKPKPLETVVLEGTTTKYVLPDLPNNATSELEWAWESLEQHTRARGMLVFWRDVCVWHAGAAAEGCKPASYKPGPILQKAISSGKGTYFANLAPFPGRVEFEGMIPENTPCAIVQPVGEEGVVLLVGDAQRAFSRLDQAWVAAICDKLDTTLEGWVPAGQGFKQKAKAR